MRTYKPRPRIARHDPERAIVRCTCGASYTPDAWGSLDLVLREEHADLPRWVAGWGATLEQRACSACGVALSRSTVRVVIEYRVEPTPCGGFVAWRRAGAGVWSALGVGRRAHRYRTHADALGGVQRASITDRGAATVLGVEIIIVIEGRLT